MTEHVTGGAGIRKGSRLHFKDAILDELAEVANVAQFVSYSPTAEQRFSRVHDHSRNHQFNSPLSAVEALLSASVGRSVNVRSFDPAQPKAHEFVYGLTSSTDALATLHRITGSGLHAIVNETIDVDDGGVSGVAYGGLLEFAPHDTPRCVEKPGTFAIPVEAGIRLLETVYGFEPALRFGDDVRVEFSIHPFRRGFRREHTIVWELEYVPSTRLRAEVRWPNRFSRHLGDKAFGLLVANAVGLPVPRTTVLARAVAPFSFGVPTGSGEIWIRTCPIESVPGRFTTHHGWLDPYALMSSEDPDGAAIASVLAQEGVLARYSGAIATTADGGPIVEGVSGTGDDFMLGTRGPEPLPSDVLNGVLRLLDQASDRLGPVRFEWVHDGSMAWIVQLHQGATAGGGRTIFPGRPGHERRFLVSLGLEALRELVFTLDEADEGVVLVGDVGVTSHFGDVLRQARVPSRIEAISRSLSSPAASTTEDGRPTWAVELPSDR